MQSVKKYLEGMRTASNKGKRARPVIDFPRQQMRNRFYESIEAKLSEKEVTQQLLPLMQKLKENQQRSPASKVPTQSILKDVMGFSLRKDKSTLWKENDTKYLSKYLPGQGVFLDGEVEPGKVVAIYPGTVYLPGDPGFVPSIYNNFILERTDGVYIDAKPSGLSKSIYTYLHKRNKDEKGNLLSDSSWLGTSSLTKDLNYLNNPLSVGHYINHRPENRFSNVMYFEYFWTRDIPYSLWHLIPNNYFMNRLDRGPFMNPLHSVVLISVRKIKNEELFSDQCFIGRQSHYDV